MGIDKLKGEWVLDHSENFDNFLKATGMGFAKRILAKRLGGSLTIIPIENGNVRVIAVNGPVTRDNEIVLGKEFEGEGADGTKAKGKITEEGDKMIGRFRTEAGKDYEIVREIEDKFLVQKDIISMESLLFTGDVPNLFPTM
ncbi:fatty acid-binding protein-like isoform X1 [Clavelina lepadiformis]|uniref:fatty acid-binding protein-like isoform X1 n=1 Tax=Clavelina lepadiformis TaxID=159417 RepID=UPI0040420645